MLTEEPWGHSELLLVSSTTSANGPNCVSPLPLQKDSLHPNPSPSECDCIWREGLCRGTPVKIRSLEWAPSQYDWCPCKKRKTGTQRDRHRREDDVRMHGESTPRRWRIGVMHLPARGHQRLPAKHQELGETQGAGPSLAPSKKHGPAHLLKSDFWPPARRDKCRLVFQSHPACGALLPQP